MRVAGRADSLICIIVPGAGAGGLRSVRAVGRAGYEKKMTRAPLVYSISIDVTNIVKW